ncbi:efflux RND transporter periplasmic adaptor subunit [Thermomicrobium sp. CFH 73360]|uniref:efflux RND transporter periplasmic adaptor subunit n=1 Tax=Thermomicrobium sp. CFH 73360 TaxID=2951987 RepID=UPI002076DD7F|nr:efflux RND transporter periplasmic adaptor subunit [Thermomicrobium sp. CFH 73360]MCM8745740.1 efflux RND transporter periplasmic adaptor subunit [Thermomicrobium sp. CFH 73360]
MNKRRRWLILFVLGLLVFAVIVLAWWVHRPSETLWTVRRGDLTGSLEVPGRIISLRTVSVRATFDTRVQILPVTLGDMVLAGDIVAVLDDTSLKARQKQAEQQLRQAEAALAQAEASEAPLDVRLRAEQQRREAADADREATARLAEKYVLAPLDGIVTEVIVTEGAPVGTGSVLLRLADLHALGVSATVDEVDVQYFEAVQDVRVTVDALPGWEGRGKVVAVGRSATQQAGVVGFPLTARLVDTTERLRPGMTATIHLAAVLRQNVLLVPEQAVRVVGERAFVTVIHDGKREEREVTLGLRSGGMVEVAVGLAEGEQVVLAP